MYNEMKLLLEPFCKVPENTLRSGVAILNGKTNLRNYLKKHLTPKHYGFTSCNCSKKFKIIHCRLNHLGNLRASHDSFLYRTVNVLHNVVNGTIYR